MIEFKVGDPVAVNDPGLRRLRDLMTQQGRQVKPNHHGTVDEIFEDGYLLILFDDGQAAPYPPDMVRHRKEDT